MSVRNPAGLFLNKRKSLNLSDLRMFTERFAKTAGSSSRFVPHTFVDIHLLTVRIISLKLAATIATNKVTNLAI